MVPLWGRMRRRAFRISPDEVSFERRGFWNGHAAARERLEHVGATFLVGYHAAIEQNGPGATASHLETVDLELRGFAYEGAAMGFALMDYVLPWKKNRLRTFLDGPASAHAYMVHVGVGWAVARLRRPIEPVIQSLDPLVRWLVVDGYGFCAGYFDWRKHVAERVIPKGVYGYARRAFDQGLGRCLWFVDCADADRIAATITGFDSSRQSDLWSGVGLAATYAGGVDRQTLERLRAGSGEYRPELAQGAVFAAKARQRAGNPTEHTDLACQVFCETSADVAAGVADDAMETSATDGTQPVYELWRHRIRSRFADSGVRET